MIKVRLKNAWFDGTQLREPGIQDFPDSFEELLPPSAELLDEKEAPMKKAEAVDDKASKK